MFTPRSLSLWVAATLALTSSVATAGSYTFNARQDAMGGAGVSSANYLSAPFYNPARLAMADNDDQAGLLLPVIGGQLFDEHRLIDKSEDFVDTYDEFQDAFKAFEKHPTDANAERLLDADAKATSELQQLQGVSAYGRAGAGAAVALPFDLVSSALFINGYMDAQGFADVDMDDFTVYDIDGIQLSIPHNEEDILSQEVVMAAGITDVGLTVAKSFAGNGMHWSLGVTPKLQKLEVYNYVVDVANTKFSNMTNDKYLKKKNAFNLDLGMAAEWNNGWGGGLAIKNLFKQTLDSRVISDVQSRYELNPLPTASVSYRLSSLLLTSDLDLLAQKRFTGLTGTHNAYHAENDDLQAWSLGAEWDVLGWLQLRGGYRHDLQSNLDDAITAGVGLSPFEVFHFDLSGLYAGSNEYGASLQTSFTF
jgi:hypothetical protein